MSVYREVVLAASEARTASGNGDGFVGFSATDRLAAQLVVAARSGTNPTLDVTIQHSIDGGTTWHDLTSFSQATAAGTSFIDFSEVMGSTAQVYGDRLRAKWTLGGTNPSFTFSVAISAEGPAD
jgi:hypothetical protein